MVTVSCNRCGNSFYAKPSHQALGYGKYCSATCQHEAAKNGKVMKCHICGSDTYKTQKALKRSKSEKFFCSKSCQTQWRNQVYIGKKHANYKTGRASYRSLLSRAGIKQECRRCHARDVRVLAAHHIDHDRNNNVVENLMYLCHNCHYLIHEHKSEERKLMAIIV